MIPKNIKMRMVMAFVCFSFIITAPASATILWAGGEPEDFIVEGAALGFITNAGYYNSAYARGTTSVNTPGNFAKSEVFTPTTSFWAHFAHRSNFGALINDGSKWVQLVDNSGIPRIIIEPASSGTTFTIKISTLDASSTKVTLVTSTENVSYSLADYDVFVNYAVAGEIKFYHNKKLIASYSGDITTNGVTSLAQFQLGTPNYSPSRLSYYSEIIVSTTETRNMHLATLEPVANGNTMNWSGAVSDVNIVPSNEATFISSGTAAEIAQFTVPALPSGSFSVIALVQKATALKTIGSPPNLQFSVRTGGTDYSSSSYALDTVFTTHSHIWATNPDTTNPWTTAELGAAGFNLGIKSVN